MVLDAPDDIIDNVRALGNAPVSVFPQWSAMFGVVESVWTIENILELEPCLRNRDLPEETRQRFDVRKKRCLDEIANPEDEGCKVDII